jgi:Flp pilus assembly secretin CpaC
VRVAVAASQGPQGPQSSTQALRQAATPALVSVSVANVKLAQQKYILARSAEDARDWRAAYEDLAEAARLNPNNHEYPVRRDIDRGHVVQMYVDRAERDAISDRLVEARADLSAAIALDPTDATVRERWDELSNVDARVQALAFEKNNLAGEVVLAPTPGVHDFDYKGSVQGAYEEVARQFGLHVTFDVDLTASQVRFQIQGADFKTAMKVLGDISATFFRPLASDLFFVAQDSGEKRKQYEASVARTVLLPAASTPEDMTEVLRVVRDVTGITRTEMDTRSRTITFRGDPQTLALATKLVEDLEKPRGQMMLDVEILEVNRQAAMNLGIIPPQTAQAYALNQQEVQQAQSGLTGLVGVIESVFGSNSSVAGLTNPQIAGLIAGGQLGLNSLLPPLIAFGGGASTFLATLPGATANFSNMLSLVKEVRHVRLRAEDGHPATFFVGDRVPVSFQQYQASLTSSENIPNISAANFPTSTLDTGTTPTFVATATLRTSTTSSTTTTTTSAFPDILEVNSASDTLSVFLGNGDGTFQNRVDYPTGHGPVGIATGDFNNDGNLDVAVLNQGDNTITIFLGNGTGVLKAASVIPVGHAPTYIISADFNSDGKLDLAVTNFSDNTLSVLLGNGDGTFQPQALYATGNGPAAVCSADFNQDGHPDIAEVDKNDNTVSVFIGNGDGTFKPRVAYATGAGPVAVQTQDLNGDTIPDLAVANSVDSTLSILLGNGDGTFGVETPYPTNTTPVSLVISDFNEDGRPDIAVAEEGSNTVGLFIGTGGGIFSGPLDLSVGTEPVSVAEADFNQDGLPDLVVVNESSNTATVIINSNAVESATLGSALTGTTGTSAGNLGTPYPSVEYLDLGVKLKATPRLHADNEVTLQLSMEIRALSGNSLNDIPIVSNRTVEQTVRLRENESTLLSGFEDVEADHGENGLPGISTLPGMNVILGDLTRTDNDDEVLILITPKRLQPTERKDTELYAGHEPRQGGGRSVGASFDERMPQQFQQPENQQQEQQQPPQGRPQQGLPPGAPRPGQPGQPQQPGQPPQQGQQGQPPPQNEQNQPNQPAPYNPNEPE